MHSIARLGDRRDGLVGVYALVATGIDRCRYVKVRRARLHCRIGVVQARDEELSLINPLPLTVLR